MSDPVAHVNIDDVLSSIRRLVSEGGRGKPSGQSSKPPHESGPDRLVLTPDFRVSTPEPDDTPSEALDAAPETSQEQTDAQTVQDGADLLAAAGVFDDAVDEETGATLVLQPEQSVPDDPSDPPVIRDTLEATIAELESRIPLNADDWEPDGSEVTSDPTWESAGFVAAPRADVEADQQEVDDVTAQVTDGYEDVVEVAADEDLAEDAPDADATFLFHREPVEDALIEPSQTDEPAELVSEQPGADDRPLDPQKVDDDARADAELAAEVAEVFRRHPLPDADVEAAAAAAAIASQRPPHRWATDAARLHPVVQPDDEADYADELAEMEVSAADEVLERYLSQAPAVDEALLRQIVVEVIREELQGSLGERITRNVRKLVRREIHNILTQQEFN